MKKGLFLALALSLTGALVCHGKDIKYEVKGSNAPKDGAKVYLVDQATMAPIDSAVVAGGSFSLKGNADEDALLAISVEGVEGQIPFFNDGAQVQVNVAEGILTGSALNTKLSECDRRNKAEYADYMHFVDAFASLPEEEQMAQAEEWTPKYDAKIRAYANFFVGMVDENKDNLIPVAFVEQLPPLVSAADDWNKKAGEDKLEELLSANPRVAKHPVVVNLKNRMAAADAARKARAERNASVVGEKFLDYEGLGPDGKEHKLSEFVGISFDREKEAWTAAITDWEMPWTHLYGMKDGQAVAGELYGVEGIPDNVLIAPDGTVVARGLHGQELADKIAEIIR